MILWEGSHLCLTRLPANAGLRKCFGLIWIRHLEEGERRLLVELSLYMAYVIVGSR